MCKLTLLLILLFLICPSAKMEYPFLPFQLLGRFLPIFSMVLPSNTVPISLLLNLSSFTKCLLDVENFCMYDDQRYLPVFFLECFVWLQCQVDTGLKFNVTSTRKRKAGETSSTDTLLTGRSWPPIKVFIYLLNTASFLYFISSTL